MESWGSKNFTFLRNFYNASDLHSFLSLARFACNHKYMLI